MRTKAGGPGAGPRLTPARLRSDPPNFLGYDEPTHHLDLATQEMLVDALQDLENTRLFLSHGRASLRGLAARVLELGGDEHSGHRPTLGTPVEVTKKTGREAPGVHS